MTDTERQDMAQPPPTRKLRSSLDASEKVTAGRS
jgi:hypothetical protein